MATNIKLIWVFCKPEYFGERDWTGVIALDRFRKLIFRRRSFWVVLGTNALSRPRLIRHATQSVTVSPGTRANSC
jgi:hypothetical protein